MLSVSAWVSNHKCLSAYCLRAQFLWCCVSVFWGVFFVFEKLFLFILALEYPKNEFVNKKIRLANTGRKIRKLLCDSRQDWYLFFSVFFFSSRFNLEVWTKKNYNIIPWPAYHRQWLVWPMEVMGEGKFRKQRGSSLSSQSFTIHTGSICSWPSVSLKD